MADNLDRPGTARKQLYQREKLRFYVDDSFAPFEQSQLKAAAELACDHLILERPGHQPLYDCAVNEATEPVASNWAICQIGLWHDLFFGTPNGYCPYPRDFRRRGRLRGGISVVRIVKLWDEPPVGGRYVLGRAYVGDYLNGPSIIAMSQEWINGEYTFDYPTIAQIAGTMVHEMLHTFGLTHPRDATGTYIRAYGRCFPKLLDGGVTPEFDLGVCGCTGKKKGFDDKIRSEKLFFVNLQKGHTDIFSDDKVDGHYLYFEDVGCDPDDPDEPTYELYWVYVKEIDGPTKEMIKDWRGLPYVCYVEQNDDGSKAFLGNCQDWTQKGDGTH